jgi:F0F1-type ATP synthase assembly protein I
LARYAHLELTGNTVRDRNGPAREPVLQLEARTDSESKREWKKAGRLSAVGLEMGFAIMIGVFGGGYLDDRFGTTPVLFWIGFAIGLGAAAKALYDGVRVASGTVVADDENTSKKV